MTVLESQSRCHLASPLADAGLLGRGRCCHENWLKSTPSFVDRKPYILIFDHVLG
jgi:hypothetical protein